MPTREELEALFTPEYFTDPNDPEGYRGYGDEGPGYLTGDSDAEAYSWEEAARLLLKQFPDAKSFLDLGCANGQTVRAIMQEARKMGRKVEAFGVDLSAFVEQPCCESVATRIMRMDFRDLSPAALIGGGLPTRVDVVFSLGCIQYATDEELPALYQRMFSVARQGIYFEVVKPHRVMDNLSAKHHPKWWLQSVLDAAPVGWDVGRIPDEESYYQTTTIQADFQREVVFEQQVDAYTVRAWNSPPAELPFHTDYLHNETSVDQMFGHGGWWWYELVWTETGEVLVGVAYPEPDEYMADTSLQYYRPYPNASGSWCWLTSDPEHLIAMTRCMKVLIEGEGGFDPDFEFHIKNLWPEPALVEKYGSTPFMFQDGRSYIMSSQVEMPAYVAAAAADRTGRTRGKMRRKFRLHEKLGYKYEMTTLKVSDPAVRAMLFEHFYTHTMADNDGEAPEDYFWWFEMNYAHLQHVSEDAPDSILLIPIRAPDGALWGVDIWIRLPFAEGNLWERCWCPTLPLTDAQRAIGFGLFTCWATALHVGDRGFDGLSFGADSLEIIEEFYSENYYKEKYGDASLPSLSFNIDTSWGIPDDECEVDEGPEHWTRKE